MQSAERPKSRPIDGSGANRIVLLRVKFHHRWGRPMTTVLPNPAEAPYTLRISRLTIDKSGVKLYDKVSAVVAELIAVHDADATDVWVELPLGTELATKDPETKQPVDKGFEIVVRDQGHGMTPEEARNFYLQVGRDPRGR